MDVLHTLSAQIAAVGLPLFAVTLTAVPRRDTPLLLMMHWHGFLADPADGGRPARRRPVHSSALQLNESWQDPGELDRQMLDAAWQLGAWQLDRDERRACSAVGSPEREALECRQAFGDDPLAPVGATRLVADAPDREDLMRLGARIGYVRWIFRPVSGGLWRQTAADDTLGAAGDRRLPCPVGVLPLRGRAGLTRYRLGRLSRLVLP